MHLMPAKNPRLTITLPPSMHAMLRRLSELTGNSQSALIAGLLEGSEPVLARTIHVLEAAEEAKEAMRGKLAADMAQAQGQVESQLGLALESFDKWTGHLLEEVEQVKRRARGAGGSRRPARATRVPPTPPSNRGVRSPTATTTKKAKRGRNTEGK